MIARPAFKSCFRVEAIDRDGVFILSERKIRLLEGRLFPLVIPQIDGRRSADAIADSLQSEASAAEVYYILLRLERSGYLEEGRSAEKDPQDAFWGHLGEGPQRAQRLRRAPISLKTLGAACADPMQAALASMGLSAGRPEEAKLQVVLTDDYLRPELAGINREALQSQKPWMLVKPAGTVLWMGPIFAPGKSCCWQCLAQRLKANRPLEAFLEQRGLNNPYSVPTGWSPPSYRAACNLACGEIARWILRPQQSPLQDCLLTLDLIEWKLEKHAAARRPQCPECGSAKPLQVPSRPLQLQSRPKRFTSEGGHRSASLGQTWQRYRHLVSPLTGVVGRLLNPLEPDCDLPGVCLGMGGAVASSRQDLKRVLAGSGSGGKGQTGLAARVSALCEAAERHCGIFQGDEPRLLGRYQDLAGKAVHPSDCIQFSQKQYSQRDNTEAIPSPFDERSEIEWTPAWSLTRQQYRYLPTAFCYFGYPQADQRLCWADSNGCAAGNNLEEAILQGFLELVERDGVALWWYNLAGRPAVDWASFEEPYAHRLEAFYRSLGRELWVLDVTTDLKIPTFAAVSRRIPPRGESAAQEIFLGFGAHFDPATALMRALTEMNQFLPAVLGQDEQSGQPILDDPPLKQWLSQARLESLPYLKPDSRQATLSRSDYSCQASDDLHQDVLECVQRAESLGMETLVLDQTRADVGLSVVRVTVPGLRHFWPRFAPGRLYEVPPRLGWIPRQLKEEELNPVEIFW